MPQLCHITDLYFFVIDDKNILTLLESLVADHRNISHDSTKDMLTWVVKVNIDVTISGKN